MLDRVGGSMREVGVIVRHHHERWDGGGYPDGLAGEAIPVASRIIAGCDALNARITTRSYRAALPLETALGELHRCAGSQFDPRVVAAVSGVLAASSAELPHAEPAADGAWRDAPAGVALVALRP